MITGEQLAIEGQDAALAAAIVAHLSWMERLSYVFNEWVNYTRDHPEIEGFTAEYVRDEMTDRYGDEAEKWMRLHPNVLPSLFGRASGGKRIHYIRPVKPKRRERHGNRIGLWKGTPHV